MITDTSKIEEIPGIQEIAKTLASHGLGIFYPHKHTETGRIIALEASEIAVEQNLVVNFIPKTHMPSNSIPVGWRWNGSGIEVCSSCCVESGPPAVSG